jgi:hypothetical protein
MVKCNICDKYFKRIDAVRIRQSGSDKITEIK